MAERLSQDNRIARLITPLGKDVLVLVRLDGTEAISENFEWRVHCLLNDGEADVDPSQIIGNPCHIEFDTLNGQRYYHGICTEIRRVGGFSRGRNEIYELVLRPWTWLLTRETSCEIFHEKSVRDIISQVFDDRGFSDFRFSLKKTYDPIHYCVRYQESPFDFISRQMEKFGLFYFFEYSDSKHELVIVDDQTSLPDVEGYGSLEFQPLSETGLREERMHTWQTESRLRTAKVNVDDYNYEKPNTALEKTGNAKDSPSHSHADKEHYHYPAGHPDSGLGQLLADAYIDMQRGDAERKFASGYAPKVFAGGAFTLDKHPIDAENVKHFGVRVDHFLFVDHFDGNMNYDLEFMTREELAEYDAARGKARDYDLASRAGSGISGQSFDKKVRLDDRLFGGDRYEGWYEVADSEKAYRTPMKTPWPRIHGAQTAEVIKDKNAPDDEEIDVDDQGRILVRFHWNDRGANSDKCSCRVRVAQIWAGSGWGGVWIPRVEMEVVVEFLNGDPDRPLVTGTVYNGNNEASIKFPDDKTQSTIKSQSSKGGTSAENFNELRFEDKKDEEEIYFHAERNRKMMIEHDDGIEIGSNQTEKIAGSRDFELTGGDETIVLKGKPGVKDKFGSTISKKGHRKTTLEKGDETLDIKEGKRTTTIKMDDKKTITDGNDIIEIKKGNQTTTIDKGKQTTTIKMGDQQTDIKLGKGTTTAMKSFEIKVGASSIKLEPAAITIKAPQVKVQGQAMVDIKGPMVKVNGSAMLMLQGGLIKIN